MKPWIGKEEGWEISLLDFAAVIHATGAGT